MDWKKVSESEPSGRKQKILESGDFLVRVDNNKLQRSNRPPRPGEADLGEMCITEFTVLEGTKKNPAGVERSWVQYPESPTRVDTDPGNVKAFVGTLLGLSEDEEPAADLFDKVYDETKPEGKGVILRLQTEMVVTTKGHDFCVYTWSPVESRSSGGSAKEKSSSPPPAPASKDAPPPPDDELTMEEWQAGKGDGTPHPTSKGWEYNPDHKDWGCRKV